MTTILKPGNVALADATAWFTTSDTSFQASLKPLWTAQPDTKSQSVCAKAALVKC